MTEQPDRPIEEPPQLEGGQDSGDVPEPDLDTPLDPDKDDDGRQ